MNARSVGFRALAVGIGLLIGVGLVELGLRFTDTIPVRYKRMIYLPQPPFKAIPVPPFTTYLKNFEGDQIYYRCTSAGCTEDMRVGFRTNPMRMRDAVHAKRKPPGSWRLLVLGDSFGVADGVPRMESWAQRLGVALDSGREDLDVELINTSRQTYSTLDQWHVLQRRIRLAPDMVVIGVYLNDVIPSTANWSARGIPREQQGAIWTAYQAHPGPIGPWLPTFDAAERSEMPEAGLDSARFVGNLRRNRRFEHPLVLLRWAAALRTGRRERAGTIATIREWWGPGNTLGQEEFKWALAQIGKQREDRGIPVVAVVFPWMDGLEGAYPFHDIHERIHGHLDDAGIAWVDMLQPFQEAVEAGTEPWAHPTDHHPSSALHAVAADAVLPLVQAQAR
jgi:hypothetical protein